MKKIVSLSWLLAAMLIAGSAFAQVSFGVKGSFNMFNLAQKDADGDKIENKMIPAFDAGLFLEIPFADEFALRPELLFAAKGAKSDQLIEATTSLNYVELPVLLLYKGALSGGSVLLGFGPYIAMGISGKVETSLLDVDVKFKNDISAIEALSGAYVKPLDFGGKIMAGYEFGFGLSAAINASYGMSDIYPKVNGEDLDNSLKNVGFGLTLGYRFGSK